MATALERFAGRMRYGAGQVGRMAWFLGHDAAMTRLRRRAEEETGPAPISRFRPTAPVPDQRRLFGEIAALFQADLANVERGFYPMPEERVALPDLLARSRAFFADLPAIHRRRMDGAHQEVFTPENRARLPRYYLQNFHYQTDGYLSDRSARIYDLQVEVLFKGTADAMRRQALVPIARALRGRDQREVALIDVACGTGRFLDQVKQAYPLMPVTGVDLSEAYIAEARRHTRRRSNIRLVVANGEHLPFADGRADIVTTIFMFHELPPKVRRIVAAEFARVLKPGGLLVFMESVQRGDVADFDGLLEAFPIGFHEPYYESYTREDLDALFGEAGFRPVSSDVAFLSKISAYQRV